MRYEFGKNWSSFIENHFSDEKVQGAKRRILHFLGKEDLDNKTFLDIGCGSGLHSLAAFLSGARLIVSFDYDPQSVAATRILHRKAGEPKNWKIMQGSVLDEEFLRTLGHFDFVYSWGVLHHTGQMWQAIKNTKIVLDEKGVLFIALYCTEVFVDPTPQDWLRIKKDYNQAGSLKRKIMDLNYALNATIRPTLSYDYLLLKSRIKYWIKTFILSPLNAPGRFIQFLTRPQSYADKPKDKRNFFDKILLLASYTISIPAYPSPNSKYRNPFKDLFSKNRDRGMNYWTDVRDWLGGYPMEFAGLHETRKFCEEEMGLSVLNVRAGEACTEYTFCKTNCIEDRNDFISYHLVSELVEKPIKTRGHGWMVKLPDSFSKQFPADSKRKTMLIESGKPVGWEISLQTRANIEDLGLGRHAVDDEYLYFSTTDNSSPLDNQHSYSIGLIKHPYFD